MGIPRETTLPSAGPLSHRLLRGNEVEAPTYPRVAEGPITFKGDNSMPAHRAVMFPHEVENPIQYSAPAIGSQKTQQKLNMTSPRPHGGIPDSTLRTQ